MRLLTVTVMAVAFAVPGGAQAAVPPGNLILNPGAEASVGENDSTGVDIPQWGGTGRLSAVKYASTTDGYPTAADSNAIGGGANFFSGGMNDETSTAEQTIEIPQAASEIDAGRVSFTLNAYLGGKLQDVDNAVVTVSFEDDRQISDTVFGTAQIGPVTTADRGAATKLLPRSTTGHVPAKTRQITVVIKATRGTGAHNNGYADNLSLTLDVDPTAVNDAATVSVNASPTAVNVLANDTNPDGGPKQIASVSQPIHGTVAITGGSGLTYKPTPGFCNSQPGGTADTFTYTLNGGSTASVAMTVTCAPGAPPPAVTTGGTTSVLPGTATLSGVVNPQGSSTDYHFEYGTSAAYGSSTPSANAGAGTADVVVSAPLSGLASSTVYHYRLVATSPAGTTLGVDREFESAVITCGSLPAPPSKAVTGPQVTAATNLTGTAGANTITGTVGSDRIAALGGNDCVLGLGGNDMIDAGSGDDRVDGDGMCPRAASFCIPGNAGNDVVTGGSGDDIVNGSGGTDRLSGQAGNDRVRGQSGNDRVSGGSGRDILSGGAGSDSLSGDSSDDTLRGGAGSDSISPGPGNDRVNGGSGGDTINARDGERDRVDCGSGRDRVSADRTDKVASNCERVSRRRARTTAA